MLISCSVFLLMDSTGVALYDSQFPFITFLSQLLSDWPPLASKRYKQEVGGAV